MPEKTDKSTAKNTKVKIKSEKRNEPIKIDDVAAEKVARKAVHEKKLAEKTAPTAK